MAGGTVWGRGTDVMTNLFTTLDASDCLAWPDFTTLAYVTPDEDDGTRLAFGPASPGADWCVSTCLLLENHYIFNALMIFRVRRLISFCLLNHIHINLENMLTRIHLLRRTCCY